MKGAKVFWFTGLSGAGKTTVAKGVKQLLDEKSYRVLIVDGDETRRTQYPARGFTEKDIKMNNEWILKLCKESAGQYNVILVSIISPFHSSREKARREFGKNFYEIYFSADLETVMKRDVKGLYAKAQRQEIKNLIGYAPETPYEVPQRPDFIIHSGKESVSRSVSHLFSFIAGRLEIEEKIPQNSERHCENMPDSY